MLCNEGIKNDNFLYQIKREDIKFKVQAQHFSSRPNYPFKGKGNLGPVPFFSFLKPFFSFTAIILEKYHFKDIYLEKYHF